MRVGNFILIAEEFVVEINSNVRKWEHEPTRAQVLSFLNSDENKVFGVTLKTPPADSMGLPHILEHAVLCGSKNYEAKRPFAELLKSSLHTFLNAFTFPDRTSYIAASTNAKDLENLKDVYFDAIFYPLLLEEVFMQEGWHQNKQSSHSYSGVVYNEMKGAFSSPEHTLTCKSFYSLYPDTVYRHEAGGTPDEIPLSRYDDLIAFHKKYYHPSNAYFFFWGDDNESARLNHLGKILDAFGCAPAEPTVTKQIPFIAPKSVQLLFEEVSGDSKGLISWNWLLADGAETTTCISLKILELILIGFPSSPLYRALMASELGEGLILNGTMTDARDWAFSIGLRGVEPANFAVLEAIVMDTLSQFVENRIPPKLVQAATNIMEFALCENNSGSLPAGISIMQRIMTAWLYSEDSLAPLRFSSSLEQIKNNIKSGNPFFENLITKFLIKNPHRTTVSMTPSKNNQVRVAPGVVNEQDPAINDIKIAQLRSYQNVADSPEKLLSIPRLMLSDVKRNVPDGPSTVFYGSPVSVLLNELPTRGVCYIEAALDANVIPARLIGYLPLFARAIFEMDPIGYDGGDFSMDVASKTGGGYAYPLILDHLGSKKAVAKLILTMKAMPNGIEDLFLLMTSAIMGANFNNFERFSFLLKEELSMMEQTVFFSGEDIIPARLGSIHSSRCVIEDTISGLEYLIFLQNLNQRIHSEWDEIREDLKFLHTLIVRKEGLIVNVTCEPQHSDLILKKVSYLFDHIPTLGDTPSSQFGPRQPKTPYEALIVPSEINAVGISANLYETGYAYHGSELVILKHLQNCWLWDEVRLKGGAYRSACSLDPVSGSVIMLSERDPNIEFTLKAFNKAPRYLAGLSLSRSELDAAIVGTLAAIDGYLKPEAKGHGELVFFLTGHTREVRQKVRNEVFSTNSKNFKSFAASLSAALGRSSGIVIGGANCEEKLAGCSEWTVKKIF